MNDSLSRRIGAISDVHGNIWALKAVLEDMRSRGVTEVVNMGDSLHGPLDPAGTAKLLLPLGAATVSGNQDREIIDPGTADDSSPTLRFVREELDQNVIEWLRSLPTQLSINHTLTILHGTPRSDTEYLLRWVGSHGLEDRPVGEVAEILTGIISPVILCGHDHLPGGLRLPDGRLVVNPGSVGLQAYTDDDPSDHSIQTGSPEARYAILTDRDGDWQVEFVVVAYDFKSAADLAAHNGRPDWAVWLETGLAERSR